MKHTKLLRILWEYVDKKHRYNWNGSVYVQNWLKNKKNFANHIHILLFTWYFFRQDSRVLLSLCSNHIFATPVRKTTSKSIFDSFALSWDNLNMVLFYHCPEQVLEMTIFVYFPATFYKTKSFNSKLSRKLRFNAAVVGISCVHLSSL